MEKEDIGTGAGGERRADHFIVVVVGLRHMIDDDTGIRLHEVFVDCLENRTDGRLVIFEIPDGQFNLFSCRGFSVRGTSCPDAGESAYQGKKHEYLFHESLLTITLISNA